MNEYTDIDMVKSLVRIMESLTKENEELRQEIKELRHEFGYCVQLTDEQRQELETIFRDKP